MRARVTVVRVCACAYRLAATEESFELGELPSMFGPFDGQVFFQILDFLRTDSLLLRLLLVVLQFELFDLVLALDLEHGELLLHDFIGLFTSDHRSRRHLLRDRRR